VGELDDRVYAAPSTVSHHLEELDAAGIIEPARGWDGARLVAAVRWPRAIRESERRPDAAR